MFLSGVEGLFLLWGSGGLKENCFVILKVQ